jgi:sialate O-acetylesterase
MLNPVIPYGIKGVIWYQGESNANRAAQYSTLFPAMINDWRRLWAQGNFPFLFVQLANYQAPETKPEESDWAQLREAQAKTLSVPSTGMACIIDIGEAEDIHPRNKKDVGHRLALQATNVAYGGHVVANGPRPKDITYKGNTASISYENAEGGLVLRNKYGYLNGFAVAGADGKFYFTQGKVVGSKVELMCPAVPEIKYVRYGWANNPSDLNLYNKEGLPAEPFRTDTFVAKQP